MEFVQRIRKTDLARNTRRVIDAVQRGRTILVESHGEPEAAIIDIVDYRILRAVMRHYTQPDEQRGDVNSGLTDEGVCAVADVQARYDLVLSRYLAVSISLARAAELLEMTWLDLRTRLQRLDIPVRSAPTSLAEAQSDVETAGEWADQARP